MEEIINHKMKCKNCGHDEDCHDEEEPKYCIGREGLKYWDNCDCKQFIPQEEVSDILFVSADKPKEQKKGTEKEQKGCGIVYNRLGDKGRCMIFCGDLYRKKIQLCPSCSNNSSPRKPDSSVAKTENLRSGLVSPKPLDKDPDDSETRSSDDSGSDFILSEKINFLGNFIYTPDVEEFIRLLKEDGCKYVICKENDKCSFCKIIDKRVGELNEK